MQWWCKRAAAATVTHAGLATIYFDTKMYHIEINYEIYVFCHHFDNSYLYPRQL